MDNIITGSAVFIVIWWLILFLTLPFGVRPPEADEMEPGQEPGAPVKPMMWRKVVITTLITIVVWVALYLLGESGWINFRPQY